MTFETLQVYESSNVFKIYIYTFFFIIISSLRLNKWLNALKDKNKIK